MSNADYSRTDLVSGLKAIGICPGDIVFFQVSHLTLGRLEYGSSDREVSELLFAAMEEVIGPAGTMLLPAFSFSFCKNDDFDPLATPADPGPWSASGQLLEYFRLRPGVIRSADPIFSVAGCGQLAEKLLTCLPNTSFGKDCVYERLKECGGKICGIGASLAETPFLHHVEETDDVPFRYKKLFTGRIKLSNASAKAGWIATVPIRAPNGLSDGSRVEAAARSQGLCRVAEVGLGQVVSIDCASFYDLVKQEIARDPWVTARGPAGDPIALEDARTGASEAVVQLPDNASMEELISALWKLPRDIVSDGYDRALRALSTQVAMSIHEYPTGTECWTWLVPEKWTCKEAWLETMDGRRLFSYADNPLHVVSYSLPVDREVSREELFEHLHVHPGMPDAIPFVFKYYERDWGLCCSRNMKETLLEDRYRVVIRSDFSYGTLKVGEVTVPGKSKDTFVLCAHLCHPAMVNDDLSGVVVGLKVMQALRQRRNLRYTYRFLIVPETIGSVAYLNDHQDLIPNMIGGLFLEMLGLQNPHALQLSFAANTEIDRCLTQTLTESDPQAWIGPFRTVVGNDERQFNAPGVRVPMLSLSRVRPKQPGLWPYYPEYHSSQDMPELASVSRLAESRTLVLRMIDALEGNVIPVNRFRGEIFCSRFGLNIDVYTNPEGHRALFDIIFLIDGTKSVAEIARICNASVDSVHGVVERLRQLNLVEYAGT